MAEQQIEWEKAWEVFWDRYKREAPNVFETQAKADAMFKEL